MAEPRTYEGGCHCGAVRYEVTLALDTVVSCNCSMCQRRGSLFTFTGTAPGGADTVAINARCLDDIDLDALAIRKFDGRSR